MPTDDEFLFGDYAHRQGPYAYGPLGDVRKPAWSAGLKRGQSVDASTDPKAETGSFRDTYDTMMMDSYPKGGAVGPRAVRDT